mmetsp:Transcript_29590/g.41954  ORF Transcript_29590/g.41954 Transcript_29590/m.41954 type:complete len:244 (-) Transcript_29590:105-836(-)
MVAFNPCKSPSAMIGLTTSTAPDLSRASLDPDHWARLRMTNREKSSRELEVQRDGGAVVARMFSTTHFGISVCPMRVAFSSLLARFLIKPQAQRTPSDFPDPDLGADGELVNSFSRTRKRDEGFSRGVSSFWPSSTGECCKMVVMLASRKERFMRQMQHKYDSCLSSAMTVQSPPITSCEAGPSAMTRLFSVGMERLLRAKHAKCRPSPLSCVRHLARGVKTSHFPLQTIGTRLCLCPTSHSS